MKAVLSLAVMQLLASCGMALPSHKITKRQNASTWDPPADLVTPLNEVWEHEVSTYTDALGFTNYGYDQVMDGAGKINYCVRWDSTQTVSQTQREDIETAVRRSFNKWIAELAGFDGFPYSTVDVNVVGWAVRDESLLEGDTSGVEVYTTTDADGIPECDPSCGRFFHQDGDYSGCAAGADRHYDQSLWLTDGFEGGAGGDWGQRVGQEYFMQEVNSENIHIVLHEMGHTFALDDFYDWTPTGVTSFIMLAGSAMEITEFDAWMARDWWRHLKSRYNL
ncbi:hypothetical protein FE257_011089 [Aspergillus nanangensis]|uniref:Uncharacterized protein n=1 Tax=Aspergillus nanangensis TaxID=2582783 RepID=A0AAD4GRR7_ASPNN|nr:hypothetical protein FE257_011089 [Aspergillus nanangensis]